MYCIGLRYTPASAQHRKNITPRLARHASVQLHNFSLQAKITASPFSFVKRLLAEKWFEKQI